jgi:hypothetical protein
MIMLDDKSSLYVILRLKSDDGGVFFPSKT